MRLVRGEDASFLVYQSLNPVHLARVRAAPVFDGESRTPSSPDRGLDRFDVPALSPVLLPRTIAKECYLWTDCTVGLGRQNAFP